MGGAAVGIFEGLGEGFPGLSRTIREGACGEESMRAEMGSVGTVG